MDKDMKDSENLDEWEQKHPKIKNYFEGKDETEEEKQQRIIEKRIKAKTRLDRALDSEFNRQRQTFMAYEVMKLYGYDNEEIKRTSISTAHDLATDLIASDLLYSEFFDIDGSSTKLKEDYYADVDPEDFKVIPKDWNAAERILKKKLVESGWREQSEYDESKVGLRVDTQGDIVAEYTFVFGQQSIIALPFTIDVGSSYISVSYQDDFIPPYGGKYSRRTVYVPLDTYFPASKVKPGS